MPTDNLNAFQLDLANFAKVAVPEQHGVLVKKIAFEVFKGVVEKTPVKTGRARGNWGISVGVAESIDQNSDAKQTGDPLTGREMGMSQGAMASMNDADASKKVIWVSNNLPYIEALENGHSKQTPQGMVETTLNEVQDFINSL